MAEIRTYTGVRIDPIHPDEKVIDIIDIAHALSLLCRANGHFKTFYSVGQHSINCMMEARARGYSKKVQFACLLHDASEAYLSDVTRPVKQEMPQYQAIEKPLQDMIWLKYIGKALTEEEFKLVRVIDDVILYYEFIYFMNESIFEEKPELKSNPTFVFEGFEQTENEFKQLFEQLIAEI